VIVRLAIVLCAMTALLAAAPAANASCIQRDARTVLAAAEAGIVGTIVDQRGDDYVIRVERVVKGDVRGDEVVVRNASPRSSAGLSARVGERLGLGLRSQGSGWTASDCERADADAMLLAADSAAPCARGGSVALPGGERAWVLGCVGTAPSMLELQGRRRANGSLCIAFYSLTTGTWTPCTRTSGRRGFVAWVQGVTRGSGSLLLSGPSHPAVRRIVVRHRTATGPRGPLDATLVRVSDPSLLRRLGVARPFGAFVVRLEEDARRVRMTAFDASGRRTGRVLVPRRLRRG
jgi:hypothetical protein